MSPDARTEVAIVLRRLPEYRVPLFRALRTLLEADGVRLRVLHGEPNAQEARADDEGRLDWAERLGTRYLWRQRLCWQPFARRTRKSQLVVIQQEDEPGYNLWSLLPARPRRFALWGRGVDEAGSIAPTARQRFTRALAEKALWWFTSTEGGADLLRREGFSRDRITYLENAIDTVALTELLQAVTTAQIDIGRRRLGLKGARVALFLGTLKEEKRLPFLLSAAEQVLHHVPGFRLLIAGDGPLRPYVEEAASSRPWLRYLGHQARFEKALVLRQCELMVSPGGVGVGILDAFTAGIPLVTTNCPGHGPEIAYLRSGENGLMTENSMEAFVRAVVALLQYEDERRRLGVNAQHVASHFTIENMAQRFRNGILGALRLRS
ncbi:MAG TPA: glycosyltransferase family 4 protein [Burkholderiaceae bacterium]|nr:glycosyltransferase family 4 protein [Burkholderiaceae bacterium]